MASSCAGCVRVAGHPVLDPHRAMQGFVARESIRSTAALRLVVREEAAEEIVGVMFVNYREVREFSADDKSRLTMLASLSAVALKTFEMSKNKLATESAIAKLVAGSLASSRTQ